MVFQTLQIRGGSGFLALVGLVEGWVLPRTKTGHTATHRMFWLRISGVVDCRPTYSMETSASRLLRRMQSGKHKATRNARETPPRVPRLLPAAHAKIWCD